MGETVTHLIIGLGKGGAETMLYQVLKYRTDLQPIHRVISLGVSHYYEQLIRELGLEVVELDLKKKPLSTLVRLPCLVKGSDTLCCWMYHANLLGYIAGRIAGVKKILWSIHHSNLDPNLNSSRTLRINHICARWSRKGVSGIIYSGVQARTIHESVGYLSSIGAVVENGCDCQEYAPDASAADLLRAELGVPETKKVILSVTKFTPIKDIPGFIRAFSSFRKAQDDVVAVLCGLNVTPENQTIAALCQEAGLAIGKDIYLLGMRHDVPRLLAACDLYVLHSAGEAFPVTLVQAMASGCLCITTDVGDARGILDQENCVVPPGDPQLLAEKMGEMMNLTGDVVDTMTATNRCRALERYEIREVVKQYEEWF